MNGDVNIGVLGASGVGKSSFVNAIRHVRNSDAIAAKVGVVETTEEPTKYHFPSPSVFTDEGQPLMCYIWDVPGAGTRKHPVETYIRDMGLRYFDLVVLMTADRFTEVENDMLDQLRRFKVPYFIVRSKIDATIHAAIVTEEDERGQSLSEEQKREIEMGIVAQLRFFFRKEQVYVISTLSRFLDHFDFRTLERDISAALASGRSIDVEQECPVCLEIYQNCGGQAGLRTVVAPCGHSICATCLQFTLNSPDPTCRMCKHLITPR
jgi:GTP-binding protein EngB required for normal cell division